MMPFSHPSQRSRYRSARSVRPSPNGSHHTNMSNIHYQMIWNKSKAVFFAGAIVLVGTLVFAPIMVLEGSFERYNRSAHQHPTNMLHISKAIQQEAAALAHKVKPTTNGKRLESPLQQQANAALQVQNKDLAVADNEERDNNNADDQNGPDPIDDPDSGNDESLFSPLVRGVNKKPLSETPALVGAGRGSFQCEIPANEEVMVYWNSPQGHRDQAFETPFQPPDKSTGKEYYLTFQPDRGGWNNIRMSMEILFVMAAATGRTLVLPPKTPLYLLGHGKEGARSFGDFFPLDNPELQKKVKIITMKEFIEKESPGWTDLSQEERTKLQGCAEMCLHKADSDIPCDFLHLQLQKRGFQPNIKPPQNCYIFDETIMNQGSENPGQALSDEMHLEVDQFCGTQRKPVFFSQQLRDVEWIHWDAGCDTVGQKDTEHCYRLLSHFYTFMFFTDPKIDNYYKRFVRDFLHYNDAVNCAAWKVVQAVQKDADALNVPWSTLHVRRGDLQYKKVKIPAEEWYENTKEVWRPGELLYIATDERNKQFFDPIKEKNHPVRFLDDYWDIAGLDQLDKTYIGMVDTIVASHGRAFAGTWFSTFTGYINRLRGYLGKSMKDSWYSFLPRKEAMREFVYPEGNYPAREWQIGWLGIDGDERVFLEQGGKEEDAEISERVQLRLDVPEPQQKPQKYPKKQYKLEELEPDIGFADMPVARGVAGRSIADTEAVKGASRGHIQCDLNVDSLAYWNDPQGTRDQNFVSPYHVEGDEKYVTFAPDRGGWNNIRMSMEIIFVIAAVTGRTLVLPPKTPLYLLNKDKGARHRGFGDFFPLDTPEFRKRLKVITMEEFIQREGGPDGRVPVPVEKRKAVEAAANHCDRRKEGGCFCEPLYEYLAEAGKVPQIKASSACLVFDEDAFAGRQPKSLAKGFVEKRCGEREVTYWNEEFHDPVLIHFRAGEKGFRLLAHFYGILYFTNPAIENYYKRFVRDFLHYHDPIYCAAGKIVKALQMEGEKRGFKRDNEGGGGYSALHVRRGDLQYKKVKISAEEWYANTKEIWKPGEILYIATDERNKTFFEPIAKYHDLRFLDDYWDLAGLSDLDPNYMGMIDTIVSSRGRAFAGTWFSTFSGYINRMRGYHGMSMMNSWYGWKERKEAMHTWPDVDHFAYAFEWPDGWVGIDGDIRPDRGKF